MLYALWNFLFPFLQTPYDAYSDRQKFHGTIYQSAAFFCLFTPIVVGLVIFLVLEPYVFSPYLTSVLSLGDLSIGIIALSIWLSCHVGRGLGFYLGCRYSLGADYPRDNAQVRRYSIRFAFIGDAIHSRRHPTYYQLFITPSDISREGMLEILRGLDEYNFLIWTAQNRQFVWNTLIVAKRPFPSEVTQISAILFPATTRKTLKKHSHWSPRSLFWIGPLEFYLEYPLENHIDDDQLLKLMERCNEFILVESTPDRAKMTIYFITAIELNYWSKKWGNGADLYTELSHYERLKEVFKLRPNLGPNCLELLCICPHLIDNIAAFFIEELGIDPTYQGLFTIVNSKQRLMENKQATVGPWNVPQLLGGIQKISNSFVTEKRLELVITSASRAAEIIPIMTLFTHLSPQERISIFERLCRYLPLLADPAPIVEKFESLLPDKKEEKKNSRKPLQNPLEEFKGSAASTRALSRTVAPSNSTHLTSHHFDEIMSLIPQYKEKEGILAFVSGTHSQVGKSSSVHNHFAQNYLYDARLLSEILSFLYENKKEQSSLSNKDLKKSPPIAEITGTSVIPRRVSGPGRTAER